MKMQDMKLQDMNKYLLIFVSTNLSNYSSIVENLM